MFRTAFFIAAMAMVCLGHVYFKDSFEGEWEKRWIESTKSGKELGKVITTPGEFFGDAEKDKGLKTTEDSRHYELCAEMEEFSNKDKTLVVQYSVKHEQGFDCGGGYIKLLPKNAISALEDFTPDTEYNIMFGPDVCGPTRRTHVILTKNGKNFLIKDNVKMENDMLTHLYTLIINPDNTYSVKVDGVEVKSGSIADDWDILLPKMIKDPTKSKPSDWVDEKEIDDPTDIKPEGYDDIPKIIPDPEANKPEDWNDEDDGEWEPPMIDNPDYSGPWKAKQIPNPDYKGPWIHPEIDNPDYKYDPTLYAFESFKYIGIDIWQVKSGSIFNNFLITDDVKEAENEANEILKRMEIEKKLFEDNEEKMEELRKKEAEEFEKAKEQQEFEDFEDIEVPIEKQDL